MADTQNFLNFTSSLPHIYITSFFLFLWSSIFTKYNLGNAREIISALLVSVTRAR